jgi:branched-chain amino acid transport system substrate-binding protein
MIRTKKLLAIAAAGALVFAACGSDDDSGDDASTPAATDAPDTTDASESTDATESTEASESTDATESTDAPDTTDAPDSTEAGEASGAVFVVDADACDDPDAATAPIEGSLKIGTSLPLSGGPAVLFAPLALGQQAFIDYYNAENGGIDGQPIELVIKDDQYQADLTKTNVDELIFDDEVDMLSGIVGTPNNLAVRDDTNAQCIPQLAASTGAPEWGDIENYPFTSGLLVPYEIEVRVFGDYIVEQFGEGATVGLIYVNTEFGQAYVALMEAYAEENGIEIVAQETIDGADSGAPSGQMTNLVQADPDAILAIPLGAQCIAFMLELGNAQAANPDFDPAVYQTATCSDSIIFQNAQNGGADGVFTSLNIKDPNNPVYADDEGLQTYLDAMATYAPDANALSTIAIAGWSSMEVAVEAARQAFEAGDLNRVGIMNAARNVDLAPILQLDGLRAIMNAEDAYTAEGTQLVQWSDENGFLVPVGEVSDFEGSLGVFTP